ncbi:MAG: septum formation inhibitor Maf [Lachnospiraceae bacterium]|nr:septum formation inhibitor Maf [Lachnospiraceae bacterium]MCI9148992.1 septum formation inhibitor Maf [Lachnospiraceae bacterium]
MYRKLIHRKLILASASPRRRELLAQVGADFIVLPAAGEERITKEQPQEAVMELALQKAMEVAERIAKGEIPQTGDGMLVLGADTVVVCDGRILGKPRDEGDAVEMLTRLQGRTHQVFTGVALIDMPGDGQRVSRFYQETQVEMFPVSEAEILDYVKSGEPMDKAGAYGIQGRGVLLVREIRGDYSNVVGLPVAELYQRLGQLGIEISAKE